MVIKIAKISSLLSKKTSALLPTSAYKEQKVKIGKFNINYLKVGHGPHHVLCMPGIMGSIWTDFTPQVEGLNRDKFTVVAWDPPGFGKSRPPEKEFYIDGFKKDAEYGYELMKTLNIPKFSILGWSYGSWCSMTIAAKYPDAVDKLVIWGASAFMTDDDIKGFKSLRDVNAWSKSVRTQMTEVYGEELFAKYCILWSDAITAGYKSELFNISPERLNSIKCPTLILHGVKDPMINIKHVSHIQEHIPGSRIHLYPEGKHNIHMAYSEDFNKRVEEFLLETEIPKSKI